MILVDTNVISETMRPSPASSVIDWLDAQSAETLYLCSISLAELLLGIAVLPEGRRKKQLGAAFSGQAVQLFGTRILAFDEAAAKAYASVVSHTRTIGRSIGMADAQIAAIAAAHRLTVATRDVSPFEAAGLPVINPWNSAVKPG